MSANAKFTEPQIREARPEDAVRIIAYLQRVAEEPEITIPLAPGEFNPTIESEEEFISRHAVSDNSILLVVDDGSDIVGVMNITGGSRIANRHAGVLGITVAKEWRDKGLGNKLMLRAIEWANGTGILTRIELEVYSHNERAIHLYEKHGFRREGLRVHAIHQHGRYIDSLIMGLLL